MARKMTIDERLEKPRFDVKRINYILKALKNLEREGNLCEKELIKVSNELRIVRDIYKTKIKLEQLQHDAREAS